MTKHTPVKFGKYITGADDDYIARCVNLHDELVEALGKTVNALDKICADYLYVKSYALFPGITEIRRLLAKAKATP